MEDNFLRKLSIVYLTVFLILFFIGLYQVKKRVTILERGNIHTIQINFPDGGMQRYKLVPKMIHAIGVTVQLYGENERRDVYYLGYTKEDKLKGEGK